MRIRDLWPFKQKQKRFLGIDIGTSSIKVVELSREKSRGKLESYAIYDATKSSSEEEGVIQTSSLKMLDNEAAEIIKALIQEAKIQTREVIFAIPGFSTFTTLIELPMMPRSEIDQAIKFEAKQYIPIPLSDVVYDWDFVGMSKFQGSRAAPLNKKLEKAQIILVAVPKEIINRYNNIAGLAKIAITGLESETFSLIRALLGSDLAPACLVDIGARNTNVAIIDRGSLMLNHNLDTSGGEFTQVIAHGMGVDISRAEEIKRTEGIKSYLPGNAFVDVANRFQGEKEVAKLLYPIIDIIISEIDRMMNIYNKKSGRIVDKIVFAGGSSNLPGLAEYMSKKLGKTVFIGNPWSRIVYPAELEKILRLRGPGFAVAVGAAMRNL